MKLSSGSILIFASIAMASPRGVRFLRSGSHVMEEVSTNSGLTPKTLRFLQPEGVPKGEAKGQQGKKDFEIQELKVIEMELDQLIDEVEKDDDLGEDAVEDGVPKGEAKGQQGKEDDAAQVDTNSTFLNKAGKVKGNSTSFDDKEELGLDSAGLLNKAGKVKGASNSTDEIDESDDGAGLVKVKGASNSTSLDEKEESGLGPGAVKKAEKKIPPGLIGKMKLEVEAVELKLQDIDEDLNELASDVVVDVGDPSEPGGDE